MTSKEMVFERWEIIHTPYPFTEKDYSKRRPALVISSKEFSEKSGHLIAAMITTASRSIWPDDYIIQDLTQAGLPKPCVVRWKVFTLPNELVIKRLGIISQAERGALVAKIANIMLG
jgi:mRNA interferase MazF